jgi:hypothetical protein
MRDRLANATKVAEVALIELTDWGAAAALMRCSSRVWMATDTENKFHISNNYGAVTDGPSFLWLPNARERWCSRERFRSF